MLLLRVVSVSLLSAASGLFAIDAVSPTTLLLAAGALSGPLVAWWIAAKKASGNIRTTEANTLWTAAEKMRAELDAQNAKLETRLEAVETENSDLRARVREMETANDRLPRLERELAAVKAENENLHGELEAARRENDVLRARVDELERRLDGGS